MSAEIERLRARIQALDEGAIRLLAERFRMVEELGRLKDCAALPIEDGRREAALREHYLAVAAREGIDPTIVQRIFDAVWRESKRAQARGSQGPRAASEG
jgi:chorismate mutase